MSTKTLTPQERFSKLSLADLLALNEYYLKELTKANRNIDYYAFTKGESRPGVEMHEEYAGQVICKLEIIFPEIKRRTTILFA